MTGQDDIQHANFILDIRWPDAAEGETVKYRPLIGKWDAATDWQKTANGWRPVVWTTIVSRHLLEESGGAR